MHLFSAACVAFFGGLSEAKFELQQDFRQIFCFNMSYRAKGDQLLK